jgi:IS5 family transposase
MAEETLCDSEAMRRFAGIEPGDDRSPDETTILNFRHLPERHGLTEAIFAEVNAHLADKGITLRSGTLVDMRGRTPCVRVSPRNIIDAPSSTRNKARARDPEMSSTKKGNDRYFGREEDQQTVRGTACPTNAQIGADADSGVTHSRETSTARRHDSRVRDELPHGEKTSDRADKGYVGAEREAAFTEEGKVWGVMRKGRPRAASFAPGTRRSTGSSRWGGPAGSTRSASSSGSSAT